MIFLLIFLACNPAHLSYAPPCNRGVDAAGDGEQPGDAADARPGPMPGDGASRRTSGGPPQTAALHLGIGRVLRAMDKLDA